MYLLNAARVSQRLVKYDRFVLIQLFGQHACELSHMQGMISFLLVVQLFFAGEFQLFSITDLLYTFVR
jgi:hypothetical protein